MRENVFIREKVSRRGEERRREVREGNRRERGLVN